MPNGICTVTDGGACGHVQSKFTLRDGQWTIISSRQSREPLPCPTRAWSVRASPAFPSWRSPRRHLMSDAARSSISLITAKKPHISFGLCASIFYPFWARPRGSMTGSSEYVRLQSVIDSRSAQVGVIGLGYVGLPLSVAAARASFTVTGFDIDPAKCAQLNEGQSYIGTVGSEEILRLIDMHRFCASCDFGRLP